MRAVVLRAPGQAPDALEHPDPVPGPGQVLVEVLAAPVTPLDLLCASGTSYLGVPATPYVPGVQGVGRVEGRTVWFPTPAGTAPGDGSMAERAAVARDDLVDLPDGADPVRVAALGLSAVAASAALHRRGGLGAGERVLVLGAGGTVGQAAVQLARLAGAGTVVAAARSAGARERARAAGADAVVALDTGEVDELARRFRDAAGGDVDLVVDTLFGPAAVAACRALAPGGRLVNLGGSASPTAALESGVLRGRSLRVLGWTNLELTPAERSAGVAEVAALSARGELSVPHEAVPLADAATAWARQAAGAAAARLVLVP
ncbi:zinc-binding dehydrogenase [Kineococcus sp. SYSU DK004]|uniref:zinc-binding dehydrogenase n=1 Tax=Kineococcus sp. SYSU DK004 TaxID=3383125 RepID=UPI003D7C560C